MAVNDDDTAEFFGLQAEICLIAGTRPEAIKIAPLALALEDLGLDPVIVDTGQQPGRVSEALAPFELGPHHCLNIERRSGDLNELISLAVSATSAHLQRRRPDCVVVQGDTTTAMAGGLAAAMASVPVVHLEAGLRTGLRSEPFPEEINRQLLGKIAELHLAPTPAARAALEREGIYPPSIVVTGNTVVDALDILLPTVLGRTPVVPLPETGHKLLAVTVHRREAWGAGVKSVASAVRTLLAKHPSLHAAVVTHPNPLVANDVRSVLAGVERCHLLPPLPYDDMLNLLYHADVALTDSGDIQEEGPSLGLPVVVARAVTERPEGVAAGWARLVGLGEDEMVASIDQVLAGGSSRAFGNPYGDGRAALRSARAIAWHLGMGQRPDDWMPAGATGLEPAV